MKNNLNCHDINEILISDKHKDKVKNNQTPN